MGVVLSCIVLDDIHIHSVNFLKLYLSNILIVIVDGDVHILKLSRSHTTANTLWPQFSGYKMMSHISP